MAKKPLRGPRAKATLGGDGDVRALWGEEIFLLQHAKEAEKGGLTRARGREKVGKSRKKSL